MRQDISIAMITKNEASNIQNALRSCRRFSDIVVIDGGSDDDTVAIATSLGARCRRQNWLGFGPQKNIAVSDCLNNWIFSLDADEEITQELMDELSKLNLSNPSEAFEVKRISYFLGKPVRFSGWQNDFVTRLFNRTEARFSDQLVHEKVQGYQTKTRIKTGVLVHHSYRQAEDVDKKVDLYAALGAQEITRFRSNQMRREMIIIKTGFSFFRTLFLRLGFLDGLTGLRIATMNATLTYKKYWEFNRLVKKTQPTMK